MKRLLIHIGYPKTASTSLQEGLFYKLHNIGLINYLGRTTKSTHSISGKSKFAGVDWVVHIRKNFIFNTPLPETKIELRNDVLNVISDEDLTIHNLFHQAQFGVVRSTLDTAYILKNLTADADEIDIVLTLRNQVDLIQSCFLQKYRYIHSNLKEFGFKEFWKNPDGSIRQDTSELFDFNMLTSHYASVFNKEVKLLLFEDLKFRKDNFFIKLGQLMRIDGPLLLEVFGNEHFRQKGKKNEIDKIKISVPSKIGSILSRVKGEKWYYQYFTKRWYLSYSFLQNIEKKIFFKTIFIDSPHIDEESKREIFNFFEDRNKKFACDNNLDIGVLKEYGYF